MAGVEVEVALVARHVVQAVRDRLALAGAGKIMVEHLDRHLRQGMTVTGKMADQCFFLGVDAHHGIPRRLILGLEFGDVPKRRISIRMRAQRLFLAHLARSSTVFFRSLRTVDRLAGVPIAFRRRRISRRDRFVHNTPSRIGSPAVNSARSAWKLSSSRGHCAKALVRPPPFFRTRLGVGSSVWSSSSKPRRTVFGSIPNHAEMDSSPP
jgi:hypothetical protein